MNHGGRGEAFVSHLARPTLRIIATVIGNLPGCVEPIVSQVPVGRKKRAAKCRVGPVRFQRDDILDSKRREENSAAAIQIERYRERHRGGDRLVACEWRRYAGRVTGKLRAGLKLNLF